MVFFNLKIFILQIFNILMALNIKKAPKRRQLIKWILKFYSSSAIKSLPKLIPSPRADFIRAVSRVIRFGF